MADEEKKWKELVPVGDWKPAAPGLAARGLESLAKEQNRQTGIVSVFNPMALASGVEMILVPGGPFIMGSNEHDDHDSEKPMRTVTLSSYRLSKTPITVGQFRAYTNATCKRFDWAGRKPDWGWLDDHPMVRVTWDEARAYCQWAGGDLPTEAQWERAARGTDGRKYPWGNEWNPDLCVHSDKDWEDKKSTSPVNRRDHTYATSRGHTDMAGNVWQWCLDRYSSDGYRSLPDYEPQRMHSDYGYVLRGGSWRNESPSIFRSALRFHDSPSYNEIDLGFRIAGH
jgi:formylglycine-generating enzyme